MRNTSAEAEEKRKGGAIERGLKSRKQEIITIADRKPVPPPTFTLSDDVALMIAGVAIARAEKMKCRSNKKRCRL